MSTRIVGLDWVMPSRVVGLFACWKGQFGKGKKILDPTRLVGLIPVGPSLFTYQEKNLVGFVIPQCRRWLHLALCGVFRGK